MQNYTTIIGVIELRGRKCPYDVIQKRYSIGSSTLQLIMKRYAEIDIPLENLKAMEPSKVEEMFYPPQNLRRNDIPMPDFQKYYDRLVGKGSKVNMYFLWIEYKEEHPNGYQQTQFYEHFRRFIEKNYGGRDISMPVERIPGEKMFIDWVGDQPELVVDTHTGEIHKVHIFTTTLGVSSMVFAEAFMDEKLPSFIQGTVDAIQFYGGVPKYLVPDNCKTAVTKHSKDELVLNTAYQDLEEFYDTIITPPPARKPKGKATVEGHVRYLETHLIEKLKEDVYTSLESLNEAIQRIIADINQRRYQKLPGTRLEAYEKYDRPHMKPLPGGKYAACDYKYVLKIPDNYHLEYDGHYYSVLYTYRSQPAILKATFSEIRICDRNNRLLCTHRRSYTDFPKYITEDSHMKPSHLYYKDVNRKDGAYYRRWASAYGSSTAELIDTVLRSARHEEQAFNSCAGILHMCRDVPHGLVEEASRKCVETNTCRYSYFKKILAKVTSDHKTGSGNAAMLPKHSNLRGKDFYN